MKMPGLKCIFINAKSDCMKKKNILFFSILFFVVACSTQKKNAGIASTETQISAWGLSFNTAVIINETTETKGVNAEYAWLKKNYPGYKTKSQSLVSYDKKPFDIITIGTQAGDELKVYFDISNFFGKL